jgi:branched-chain amino acid transport system ATP-binding protein
MPILKIEKLCKSFGERILFENLTLELEEGMIYSLIGANGTGKTTLFNILTGFVKADSGKVLFENHNILSKSPAKINKIGIVRTFQDLRLINGLSVKENILLVLEKKMFHFTTLEESKKADQILERVSLLDHAEHLGSDLSYGQQKLLTLGCCLANNPKLLLLDEPVAGIDKENLEKIKGIVSEMRSEGRTILQIEHNLEYLEATSDQIFTIEENKFSVL